MGFRKSFDDLRERQILIRDDGTQYIELDFQITDLAGNVTDVLLELVLDPDAPLMPGTDQRDLPDRQLPVTLYELIEYYLITGQMEELAALVSSEQ